MKRRIHNLISDVVVCINLKYDSNVTLPTIKSAISEVLLLPHDLVDSVNIEEKIISKGIDGKVNWDKVRAYIGKMITDVIKSYIKKQYTIDDFIIMNNNQKESLNNELINWRTIFDALDMEVIKKNLPSKMDIERLAGALWGEESLRLAIKNYQIINNPDLKRAKIISEVKEHFTLDEFLNSSITILIEKKEIGWTTISSIMDIKDKSRKLKSDIKYEIAGIVWNQKDVDTIRKYNEYMDRSDVKEDMIIHYMKKQYTLDSFMNNPLKKTNKEKVNGYGWKAICTILNIQSYGSNLRTKNRDAIAQKVWRLNTYCSDSLVTYPTG